MSAAATPNTGADRDLVTAAAVAGSGAEWDAAAAGWDRHSELIRDWLRDATAAMLDAADLGPGARVLDVAAGAGDQTLDVCERIGAAGEVLATDLSPGILERARERFLAAGLSNARTALADAQALGLGGSGFDAAICRLGLMFCPRPLDALRGIRDALAPGGRFAALVFDGPEHNPCIAVMMRTALRHAGLPPGDPFAPGGLLSLGRPESLGQLMREAGFDAIAVRPLDAPFRTPACADYVAFVRSSGSPVMAVLQALAPEARERAWAEIERALSVHETPQGWRGPNRLLLATGIRPAAG